MTQPTIDTPAPDAQMAALLKAIEGGADGELPAVDSLIASYPADARLHFLRGSLLAGAGQAIEAHRSLAMAVQLSPDFAVARFQLGFFELTSGEIGAAKATWAPLERLPQGHYLRSFVAGLVALIEDRFADCIDSLRAGMAANQENHPLNHDMQLVVDKCSDLLRDPAEPSTADGAGTETSATSLLLDRFSQSGGRR